MCFKEEEVEGIISKFKPDFLTRYVSKISNHEQYFTMQMFRQEQPIEVQYYSPEMNFDKSTPTPKRFYTKFTKEGLIMSPEKVLFIYKKLDG